MAIDDKFSVADGAIRVKKDNSIVFSPPSTAQTYTLNYSTADPTHDAKQSAALTDNSGGIPGTAISAVAGSGADATINDNLASIADQLNKLRTDHLDLAQLVNSLITDLKSAGLIK